jgi:hypothetical protein
VQVLELDVGDAPKGVLREDVGTGQRHNLEVRVPGGRGGWGRCS